MDEYDRESHAHNNVHHRNPHQQRAEYLKKPPIIQVAESPEGSVMDQSQAEILHHHDNFYHTTKSLLILFQIMGVMPIEREVGRTTYR